MYFDPYTQKAMLLEDDDPNALLQATGGPLSPPMQTPMVTPPQPTIAPTGLPMASQGPQIDPGLQRDARIMGMFSNLGQLGGYGPLQNPFQEQIDGQRANYQLMTQRANALRQSSVDNPFYEYELAKSKGYFKLKEGEDDAAGFNRYTQERFKTTDPRTASMKDVEFLMGASPQEREAFFLNKGKTEVKTLPDGSVVGVNRDGTTETLWDGETMRLGAGQMKYEEGMGTDRASAFADARKELEAMPDLYEEVNYALDTTDKWLNLAESGELDDTGFVTGIVSDLLGYTTAQLAEMDADAVAQQLANLQITNLAPVTEKELKLLSNMWASKSFSKDKLIGALRSAKNRLGRKARYMDRDRDSKLNTIKQYGGDEDYNFYANEFGLIDDPEALLNQ